jgi:uncharacterized membrane protein YdjX (TVP38/TMEM64 family)
MAEEGRPQRAAKRARVRVLVAILIVVLIGAGAVAAFMLERPLSGLEMSAETVQELILSWGMWGVVGSILLMVVHSFIPFPAEIVAIANGMVYGPIWGTVITWTGAMLGAYLAFGLARLLGRPFVVTMVADRHRQSVDAWATRQGGGTLFFARFIPVISFNLINYAAGLTSISWWTFTWATGLGILPLTYLMVLLGDHMWTGETQIWIWLLAAGVAGWLAWRLIARYRRRRQ